MEIPYEPTLQEKAAYLRNPDSYGIAPERVEMRETNMSLVFLAGDYVFKLKKPVRLPYLDFSTLVKRRLASAAEAGLNRRLAPGVYLGIVPLCISDGALSIGKGGVAVDWLVKMRRLDQGRMLDSLIAKNEADLHYADALAVILAQFYKRAQPVFLRPEEFLRHWRFLLRQNRTVLLDPRLNMPQGLVRHLDRALQDFLLKKRGLLLDRLRNRHILDGHGDLRPEHIWLGNEVKIIDCLEFNSRLRALDPLEEIAYLDLECEHLNAKDFGSRVHSRVVQALRDKGPLSLYCFYRCYRAMLRARLSIAHLLAATPRTPEKWHPKALSYLRIAAADGKRLEFAIRKREGPKGVHPLAGGGLPLPIAERKEGFRPCSASCRASRGRAERYPWLLAG
ncbi:MAG: hypothetical protein WBX25_07130 [Rhodomicrobium sp.]